MITTSLLEARVMIGDFKHEHNHRLAGPYGTALCAARSTPSRADLGPPSIDLTGRRTVENAFHEQPLRSTGIDDSSCPTITRVNGGGGRRQFTLSAPCS
jgi:hypothetical protein